MSFFSAEHAKVYDQKNLALNSISTCLHFLTGLALKSLPATARVLCVGAGTGAEILSLAAMYPSWTFVALDPSQAMLDVCRERVAQAGLESRCSFVCGYVQDVSDRGFDACLAILVGHFVPRSERVGFFRAMTERVRPGGFVVNAEISYDLSSADFPPMLRNWEAVQTLMGANAESLLQLPKALREVLTVLPSSEVEAQMREGGIANPFKFFQAFMISAWQGVKL